MSQDNNSNPQPQIDQTLLANIQAFLSKPKNADKIKDGNISPTRPTDGQALVWSTSKNQWIPTTVNVGSGVTGAVTLLKLTGGGVNGSITFVNGLITAFTNPT